MGFASPRPDGGPRAWHSLEVRIGDYTQTPSTLSVTQHRTHARNKSPLVARILS